MARTFGIAADRTVALNSGAGPVYMTWGEFLEGKHKWFTIDVDPEVIARTMMIRPDHIYFFDGKPSQMWSLQLQKEGG